MLVRPDQHVRLPLEMRYDRSARGALRKVFQKCWGDVHVSEAAARLRLLIHQYFVLGNHPTTEAVSV
jgi:hypothetical protein